MPSIANSYRGCRVPPSHRAHVPPPPKPQLSRHKVTAAESDGVGIKAYLWLFDVAKAGDRCPTNKAICERYGFKSESSAARVIADLEQLGLIKVERGCKTRRVWVRELERWTA